MKKLFCFFIMLFMFFTIIAIGYASDLPKTNGKAKIFVLRQKAKMINVNLQIYINGLLITGLEGGQYIYYETNPGKTLIAFNAGLGVGSYLDFCFDTMPDQTYYIQAIPGGGIFTNNSIQVYIKEFKLLNTTDGENLLNVIKQTSPDPANKITCFN